jgi:hypothetical protein
MAEAVLLPIEDIRVYCQKWGISEFAVFGSVLRPDFNEESDIDVREDVRRTLFDLTTMSVELEAILGRKVDLLTRRSVEDSPNYIRRKSTAQVIYAE